MKKFAFILTVLMSCIICAQSFSQSSGSTDAAKLKLFGYKGIWELGGTIFYASTTPVVNGTTGSSYNIFQLQPFAGYFIAKGIELAIQPNYTTTSASGSSYTTMGLYFAPAYNFILKGNVYPAISVLLGYTSTSGTGATSTSGFSWGGEGGVKINFLGNSLLFIGIQYKQETYNPSGATSRNGQNILTFGAGWNVFF